jgi:hypothetical protein
VYQQVLKYKEHIVEAATIGVLVILSLYRTTGHVLWLVLSGRGLPKSSDSYWYISYACGLLDHFSIGLNIDEILYLGYNFLLAILLGIFKTTVTVVLIQSIVASLAIILVYKIALLLFNRTTAIISGLFYLYIWDITLWSTYVLSDSFFVSLSLLCVYLLLRVAEPGKLWLKGAFAGSALYLCFFRPTGILIAAMIVFHLALQLDGSKVRVAAGRYKWPIIGLAVVMVGVAGILFFRGVLDPFVHSLQYNAKLVLYNVYAKGWIYDIPTAFDYFYRPDYTIDVADSLILSFLINNREPILVLYVRRAIAFLGAWTWQVPIRNLNDVLYFAFKILPAGLFIWGTIVAGRTGKFRRGAIVWLIVLAVFAFCVLLFIDAMYRYRFPAMPFIAIVTAYGLERMLDGGKLLVQKYRSR